MRLPDRWLPEPPRSWAFSPSQASSTGITPTMKPINKQWGNIWPGNSLEPINWQPIHHHSFIFSLIFALGEQRCRELACLSKMVLCKTSIHQRITRGQNPSWNPPFWVHYYENNYQVSECWLYNNEFIPGKTTWIQNAQMYKSCLVRVFLME